MVDSQNNPPLLHQKHNPQPKNNKNTTPWSPAAHRPPAASILEVSLIAICYAIVLDHRNGNIFFDEKPTLFFILLNIFL
jgi:hypothetical protein